MNSNHSVREDDQTPFDLYTHMKCNIKCISNICELHDSMLNCYCIPCKRGICLVCKESFHGTHNVILKASLVMDRPLITSLFQSFEQFVKSSEIFYDPESMAESLSQKVTSEMELIQDKLDKIKEIRLSKIRETFKKTNHAERILSQTENIRAKLLNFFKESKPFLQNDGVSDDDCFIFLMIYDLVQEATNHLNYYKGYIEKIVKIQEESEVINDDVFEDIYKVVSDIFNRFTKKSTKNVLRKENPELELYCSKLKETKFDELSNKIKLLDDHIKNFKSNVFSSFKKNDSLIEIEKAVKMLEDTTSKRINTIKRSSLRFSNSKTKSQAGLTRSKATLGITKKEDEPLNKAEQIESNGCPSSGRKLQNRAANKEETTTSAGRAKNSKESAMKNFLFSLAEVEENDVMKERVNESNSSYNRSSVTHSSNEDEGSDEDIDVEMERNKEKIKVDKQQLKLKKMFKPCKSYVKRTKASTPCNKIKANNPAHAFNMNQNLLDLIKENKRLLTLIKSEEDINLKISTVRRYFSYETLEYFKKFYESKDNHNSNYINIDSKKGSKPHEYHSKIIEGKNELHLFNKTESKFTKYILPFDKKKHKISYFPVGCRTIFYNDQLYFTGGKSLSGVDLNVFLVYIPKENKLIRLADMIKPRSYHALILHDNLKSLLAFGGENNGSCEMYDFYLNMWNPLPNLNVPRANTLVHIDKIGTYAYALCGILGSITGDSYTDTLEVLDLIDMGQGWIKVDFINKTSADLKQNDIQIHSITDEKLLIYGAHVIRKEKRCKVMLDLKTFELVEVDDKLAEQFKAKMKYS